MANEKYPIEIVVLILADSEDDLHNKRQIVREIGFPLNRYEEDEEGGIWKCIGTNTFHCNRKSDVRGYAGKLKKLNWLLFDDSSAIVANIEYNLSELIKF